MALTKYKICPACGAHNPPSLLECRECETDLTGIRIVDSDAAQQEGDGFSYQMQAVGDDYTVTIREPVCIIGREAELKDYLADKMYVSRWHAKLTIADGKVRIENLSNTNGTFINNRSISGRLISREPVSEPASSRVLISGRKPVLLADGDEIGLGGIVIDGKRQEQAAYFVFHTKP